MFTVTSAVLAEMRAKRFGFCMRCGKIHYGVDPKKDSKVCSDACGVGAHFRGGPTVRGIEKCLKKCNIEVYEAPHFVGKGHFRKAFSHIATLEGREYAYDWQKEK